MTKFEGCGTALVTPFTGDGALDEAAMRKLVQRQVEAGIHFLVPCGTTGESPTLTKKEHLRVVEITLEEAGDTPVMAGCGGYDTAALLGMARELESLGAHGLLSVTPYYNKPTPEGLYQHYRALAGATKLPICVYSVAGRTGRNVTVEEMVRLAEIENVTSLKEASGNIGQMGRMCRELPDDVAVLSGDDAVALPLISLGGKGLISVASNEIPAEMSTLCEMALEGHFDDALKVHQEWLPLLESNFCETSPGPVKYAMAKLGLLEENYRLPMVPITDQSRATMDRAMAETGLLEADSAAAD